MAWYDTVVNGVTVIDGDNENLRATYIRNHAVDHKSGGIQPIKLDELAAPTNVSTLNVSIAAHGLCPILPNDATLFLNGTGVFSAPVGSGDLSGPASSTANNLPKFADATGKLLSDSGVAVADVVVTTDARLTNDRDPNAHKTDHQNGGTDEIDVTGLSGLLADGQTPLAHNQAATTITSGTLDGDRLPAISATKLGGVPATGTPAGKFLRDDDTWATPTGSGDVVGPATSTDNAIARFDLATGKLLQDSAATVDNSGTINIPTGQQFTINGSQHTHAEADVTSLATDLAALVPKSLFDAHTILFATTNDTPAALTVTEQTVVGRLTDGNIAALTGANIRTIAGVPVQSIYLYPVGSMVPLTNPDLGELAIDQGELSNGINYIYGAFPDGVANSLLWKTNLPSEYASLTFTVQFEVTTTSASSGTVKLDLAAIRAGAGTLNLTPAAVESVTITSTGADHTLLSIESSAFSITGTGNTVYWKLTRDSGTDTLPATARVLSVRITPVV